MVARKKSTAPTRVWKFGAQPPIKNGDLMWRQLRLANRYYNNLIEIERKRHLAFREIRRRHAPELAEIEDRIIETEDAIDGVYNRAKRTRRITWAETGGKKSRDLPPDLQAEVDALKKQKRKLQAEAKAPRQEFNEPLKSAAKRMTQRKEKLADGAGPRKQRLAKLQARDEMMADESVSSVWKEVETTSREAEDARLAARASCGLTPGVYLTVESAADRAKSDRLPLLPKFRRFSGEGRVAVQVRSERWSDITSGKSTMLQLERSPRTDLRGKQALYWTAKIRVGSNDRREAIFAEVPVKLHRVPPDDAVVKWAWILVRKEGPRLRYSLQVAMEHESFGEPKRPIGVGHGGHIKIGWRAKRDGSVRVATIGDSHEVVVPAWLIDRGEHADVLRSLANLHFRIAKRLLMRIHRFRVDNIASDRRRVDFRRMCDGWSADVLGGDTRKRLWLRWKNDRLARSKNLHAHLHVARKWMRSEGFSDPQAHLAFWLFLWVRKDEHMREYEACTKRKFLEARDQHYRLEAIRISTRWETVSVDDYNIAALKKKPDLPMPGEQGKSELHEQARHRLHYVAPGRFREILREVMGERCSAEPRPGTARDPSQQGNETRNGHVRRRATRGVRIDQIVDAREPLQDALGGDI